MRKRVGRREKETEGERKSVTVLMFICSVKVT